MNAKTKAFTAISLIGFVPTISILFTLIYSDDELTSQIFFMACKLWILALPTFWFLNVEGGTFSWSKPDRDGMLMGLQTGLAMSSIILVMWWIFRDTIDTDSMIEELDSNGLTDLRFYLAGMVYWIFMNSLLEEYVFRWFLVVKSEAIVGTGNPAILLSAFIFVIHHTFALHFFGFPWWANLLASLGLFIGGAVFSWLYVRYRSVWIPYIAHAICDVAVFGVGAIILF